ncbi:hypothetical protein [Rathayibacter sp. AY1A3]|uniref:hypothetical protein n=1 Tax=Rathayibacter sp. AY1A3 TaxID=2080521 RepID=UPI000CE87C99|nr:hypothetical protein [Rathayibacter sp. AY1A3]PPF36350.1 hypothetical protein C5C10_07025 [Rathayibacter sp. AY1A3]
MTAASKAVVDQIEQQLTDVDSNTVHITWNGIPYWVRQSASQIALIAGASPILYLDHSVDPYDNPIGQVVAITDAVVVVVDVNASRQNPSAVSSVFNRTAITSLVVDSVTNNEKEGDDWPRSISVRVSVGGKELTLPYRPYSPHLIRSLSELIPDLAKDIRAEVPAIETAAKT